MHIKIFFLLTCLLATTFLGANNTPIPNSLPTTQTNDVPPCNLPAPFGFKVTAVGSTWVSMGWGGSPLYQYRIRIYRESDNALLSTTIVPAGNLTATVAIPFKISIRAVINTICLDGNHSPYNSVANGVSGLILDIVVTGYNGSNDQSTCTMIGDDDCTFNNSGYTTFEISMNTSSQENQYAKKFDIEPGYYGEGDPKFTVYPEDPNSRNDNTYSYYCSTSQDPDCGNVDKITITFWQNDIETVIAILEGSQSYLGSTINKLHGNLYNYGGTYCKIERLGTGFSAGPPKGLSSGFLHGRGEKAMAANLSAIVSPNPFSETLNVFLVPSADEQITLQLFNLSGQKVLDQQFPGGQEQYSLSTAGLSTGFYLLRIEADGEVQTLKVIKSE